MRRLQGRVALVTGAGSGLGRATALRFAAEGAAVVCADLNGEAAEQTAAQANGGGGATGSAPSATAEATGRAAADAPTGRASARGDAAERARALTLDVTDLAACEAAAAELGAIDVLFHAAGIVGNGTATSTPPETWARVLEVNLTGTWHAARAVLPGMVQRRRGSIVLLASTAGIAGVPGIAAYAAAKGGVVGLTRQMAIDYAPDGVRVNAICPGTIPTPLVHQAWESRGQLEGSDHATVAAQVARQYPLGRVGEPDDCASLAAFLASDESSWMTGTAIPLEGGLTSAAWVPGS